MKTITIFEAVETTTTPKTHNMNNAKEYTNEELDAKLDSLMNEDAATEEFDYESMWADVLNGDVVADVKEVSYAEKINAFFKAENDKHEAAIFDWSNRVYKKSNKLAEYNTHSDFDCGVVSVSVVNERRRNNKIAGLRYLIEELEELKADLLNKPTEFFTNGIPYYYTGTAKAAFLEITK